MTALPNPLPLLTFRDVLEEVTRRYFYSIYSFHRTARAFRNRLVIMTGVAVGAAVALVIVQWRIGDGTSIITKPSGTQTLDDWALLVLVMLVGAVGALLTTIPAIIAIPTNPSPFNFPLAQVFLKIVLGMLTAVVGVLAIENSGLVKRYTSLSVLLGVAVVFGASQQAVTQFLDKRAGQILSAVH
jgi:hypothetical protein